MNRYQWLVWAFRLFFSREVIDGVKAMVAQLDHSELSGTEKRKLIEQRFLPILQDAGVFLLRALVEVVLNDLRIKSGADAR